MIQKTRSFLSVILVLIISSTYLSAAKVDTVSIASQKMEKSFKAIVVFPDTYGDSELPVVYLLHGWSGDYRNWFDKTDLPSLADHFQMIIVCPDGGYAGWYLDSPLIKESQYESYIALDVVDYIDQNYETISAEQGRAICGLSMGGHGAIGLLAKYPDRFAAAGSMSGVMELNTVGDRYGLEKLLGDITTYENRWKENSSWYLIEKLVSKKKGILLECGIADRLIESNRRTHRKLIDLNIAHDYYERPSGHTWDYWVNALPYHLLFFKKYFEEK